MRRPSASYSQSEFIEQRPRALFLLLREDAWRVDRALAAAGRGLGHPGERPVGKIAEAIRATVSRTVAAAIVKGIVMGVACILTGVPHPMLFAVLAMMLAMVPLGAWTTLAAAVLRLVVHGGTEYVVSAVGPLLNIAQSPKPVPPLSLIWRTPIAELSGSSAVLGEWFRSE